MRDRNFANNVAKFRERPRTLCEREHTAFWAEDGAYHSDSGVLLKEASLRAATPKDTLLRASNLGRISERPGCVDND